MIKIDILVAVSAFLLVFFSVIFVLWLSSNVSDQKTESLDEGEVKQCPYCTHIFVSYYSGDIPMCPRCQSYMGNARELE